MFGIVLMNIQFSAQWSQFWLIIVSVSHCVKQQQQQHLIYAQLADVCCESNLYSQHTLDLITGVQPKTMRLAELCWYLSGKQTSSNTQNTLATT